jgi:hypothetical protein
VANIFWGVVYRKNLQMISFAFSLTSIFFMQESCVVYISVLFLAWRKLFRISYIYVCNILHQNLVNEKRRLECYLCVIRFF